MKALVFFKLVVLLNVDHASEIWKGLLKWYCRGSALKSKRWCWTWGAWNIDVIIATLYIRRVTNVYLLRGETIMTDKPDEKAKTYRIDRKLAIELEVYARQKQVSEVSLVRRYIQEGLRRDKGQTTLDEWKNKRRKRKKENSIKTSNAD